MKKSMISVSVAAAVSDSALKARGLPEIAYVDNADKRFHPEAQVIGIERGTATTRSLCRQRPTSSMPARG